MKSLFLIGTAGSGKTAVALGLALKLQEMGYRVGYFKPVGTPPGATGTRDEDGVLMQTVLNMPHPLETIVPVTARNLHLSGPIDAAQVRERVRAAFEKVSDGVDVLLVDGASFPYVMASYGLDSVSIARYIGAAVICVARPDNDFQFDEALFLNHYITSQKILLLGNIFNNVSRPQLDKARGIYARILEQHGYRSLGVIPSRPEISAPTVAEFHETLGGELLCGEQNLDRLVEDVLVGAMTIESALGYLRRAQNKAVVTGGDRADLALAALETSTSVIILTGGLYPDISVVVRAGEKGVPVILTHLDTYTVIEKIGEVTRRIRPGDERAISLARENVDRYCDWTAVIEAIR